MLPKLTRSTLILLLLFFATATLSAQSGIFSGTVYDSDGKSTLPGASIYLKDRPSFGTVTDIDGGFTLANVPVGPQTFMISFTGYATQEVTADIVAGEVATREVTMEEIAFEGETVIVTAQALGQAKAINQQLNSDAIANFVSADKIKELPDVNAAEAISRLPGVAINRSGGEGSKIVVRGLDPKFTSISINGVRLPSTSGNDRSVDLSLISPELLSGIELFKSPTADMDADALGGSVNLNIIKAPKERTGSLKVLGGYNDITGTWKDYKATASIAQRILDGKLGITATANIERFNRTGETISQNWGDDNAAILDTALNIFAQEGNGLRFLNRQEIRKRQNGSLGLDFGLGKKSDVTILGIYSRTSRDQFNQQESYNVDANRIDYFSNLRESTIDLFSGSISTRHQVGQLGIEWGAAYSQVNGDTPLDFDVGFRNETNPVFAAGTDERRGNPANFFEALTVNPNGDYLNSASSSITGNQEGVTTGFVNLELPFQVGDGVNATLKVGGKMTRTEKSRTSQAVIGRLFYLLRNTTFSEFVPEGVGATGRDPSGDFYYGMQNFVLDDPVDFQRADGSIVQLLRNVDPEKIRRFQELYGDALLRPSRYDTVNNYDLDERVYAAFVQLKLKIGKKFTAIPGFRVEHSDNTYNGLFANLAGDFGNGLVRPDSDSVTYTVPLPHLHLKYKPLDWLDVRASYSTTLARPDYSYVVPATLIDRNNDLAITQGNPTLEPSVSTNYDLFVTAFSGKWGLLSGGVFYKDIKDAFYPFITGLNSDSLVTAFNLDGVSGGSLVGGELTTYTNSPESSVRGFEVELQTNLNFLPEPFNGLVANFNYTRLNSETTINSFREEITLIGFPPIPIVEVFPLQRDVALVGQAKDILNASLGYDYKRLFSARFSASYQGDKIAGYSAGSTKDRFNRGFWRFDAAFKAKFKMGLNLFLNLNNLSNQEDINYFTSLDRQRQSRDFITSVTRYGATATFGAEYKF